VAARARGQTQVEIDESLVEVPTYTTANRRLLALTHCVSSGALALAERGPLPTG
jgi:hypothetical protein